MGTCSFAVLQTENNIVFEPLLENIPNPNIFELVFSLHFEFSVTVRSK